MSSPVRTFMAAAGALLAAGALSASAASAAPVLYGATGVSATDTLPASDLYTINPDTGATTSVGSIGKAVTGLAFDGTDGTLYGVTAGVQLAGTTRDLLKINPATGASTVVGSLGVNEIEDIAVSPLGQLYGWNETGDDLVRINKATGALPSVTKVAHRISATAGPPNAYESSRHAIITSPSANASMSRACARRSGRPARRRRAARTPTPNRQKALTAVS